MIINLRGTGGSGKSTVVRTIMDQFEKHPPFYVSGRRQPLGYFCASPSRPEHHPLTILGHYETPCGGCDTISKGPDGLGAMDYIYQLVRDFDDKGHHVLYEGVIVGDDVNRVIQLQREGRKVLVIWLDEPLEVCLAGIQERRNTRGDERPLDPKNTAARLPRLRSRIAALKDANVPTARLNRADTLARVKQEFGL